VKVWIFNGEILDAADLHTTTKDALPGEKPATAAAN